MKSAVVKRSVLIGGHKTSVSLEDEFWNGLKEIAKTQHASLSSNVIADIDKKRQRGNLSSAILFCSYSTSCALIRNRRAR